MSEPAIDARGLVKVYGEVTALAGVDLVVDHGSVVAVLGHNGAGKTTLVDILTTRIRPTEGSARVCGFDVVGQGKHVRRRIGMTGQFPAVDDALCGRANLVLVARLSGATAKQARARADELLTEFDLDDVADRPAATYSGGTRRRLDLAAGLVGAPRVLFLDEPTTGLDPVSRAALWTMLERLAAGGTTIVLTTQYLEEADRLADHVVVLGMGRVTVAGTPAQLKARLGVRTATATFATDLLAVQAVDALGHLGLPATGTGPTVTVALTESADVVDVVRALDAARVPPHTLTVAEPTLGDIYLSLYGSPAVVS